MYIHRERERDELEAIRVLVRARRRVNVTPRHVRFVSLPPPPSIISYSYTFALRCATDCLPRGSDTPSRKIFPTFHSDFSVPSHFFFFPRHVITIGGRFYILKKLSLELGIFGNVYAVVRSCCTNVFSPVRILNALQLVHSKVSDTR